VVIHHLLKNPRYFIISLKILLIINVFFVETHLTLKYCYIKFMFMSNENEENKNIDFKKSIEKVTEFQQDLLRQFSSIQYNAFQNMFSSLQGFTNYNAMFKTNVQTGGRISIPEAERQALGIEEGDLVQVIIIPITRKKNKSSSSSSSS
jgi:hypothetical protein